ncbi:MAG: Ni/Fe-hydrogenase, b-type cytochrome subunit [Beggiatoa sp. IS2]|nr:MAG: Ni/Fe-hydrogenase, b-type cytochrome subunit [Beggiatoa sp. IS2]
MQTASKNLVGPIYVYEVPVRLWHWLMALCIVALSITGYLIANPLPSLSGEASVHYAMGYIRFIHFATAYIFAVAFVGRTYWAIVGNHHARQIFYLPLLSGHWWREVFFEIRWYLFIEREGQKCLGHNPLAQIAMFFFVTLGSIFMIVTGFALYGEGTGLDSWQNKLFGWVIPLFGQSQDVHTWHNVGMWLMICFVMIHTYLVIREDIMSRQTIVSTMVNGYRLFKDNRP